MLLFSMADQELLDIVNKNDEVVGQDTKGNKFLKGFISRNVGIFILDRDKKLLIAKRSPLKKSFPDRYDLAACGNVKAGETYDEAARREVKEELGIECDLTFLGRIFNEFREKGITIRYFTGILLGYFPGEVVLGDELVEIRRLSVREVEGLINGNRDLFTPGFVNDFLFAKDRLEQGGCLRHAAHPPIGQTD